MIECITIIAFIIWCLILYRDISYVDELEKIVDNLEKVGK